jgi:hypothetical protein
MSIQIQNLQNQNPAVALLLALQNEQEMLEQDLPKDSNIMATVSLTTGEQIKIVTAYPAGADLIVFVGIKDKKTVRLITRYGLFANCVLTLVKGKRQRVGFYPSSPSASPSVSPSASASPSS